MIIKTFSLATGMTNKLALANTNGFSPAKGYAWVANNTSEAVYVSLDSEMAAGKDGTAKIVGGSCGMLEIDRANAEIYAIGNGKIEVRVTSEAICPFKSAQRGGEATSDAKTVNGHTVESDVPADAKFTDTTNSDITASGNPVVMDGLQGSVPFSEITVSGKNLTGNTIISTTGGPVIVTNPDNWSIEWTTGFGIRLSDVKVEMNKDYTVKYSQKSENGTDSVRIMIINSDTGNTVSEQNTANVLIGDEYTDNIFTFNSGTAEHIYIRFVRSTSTGKAILSKMIQLEVGDTATEYEPPITSRELTVNVNGTEHTITPDSNPYVIPNDIRQQDGHNVITVSDGTLSVTGCKDNAAVKRIWDSVGMDLLFDGVTSADAPAVVDLAGYVTIEIHHIMVTSGVAYPVHIKMPVSDCVNSIFTRISSPITNSFVITYVTNTDSHISDVYAISAGGALMSNTKIYGIKE